MCTLKERRDFSETTLKKLKDQLRRYEAKLRDKACVFATGSLGRGEAWKESDLDVFIVAMDAADGVQEKSALSSLDETVLVARLIKANEKLDLPPFSGDGKYLKKCQLKELCQIGKPGEDAGNALTARLLLLLESHCLLGEDVYQRTLTQVIEQYWRDYDQNYPNFVPAFLVNDICRMWRTFCLNYEDKTYTSDMDPEAKAKRKYKNYQLRHSRMLTCYSALLFMLSVFRKHSTVTTLDARKMAQMTPIARLEWLRREEPTLQGNVNNILERYENFLEFTRHKHHHFRDASYAKTRKQEATAFGDAMADLVQMFRMMEGDMRLYRYIIV